MLSEKFVWQLVLFRRTSKAGSLKYMYIVKDNID